MFKEGVSILEVAKKLRDFNFLFIIKSAFSVGPMDSRRGSLVFIRGVCLSIKIAEILIVVGLELVRCLVTRDSSYLFSLNFG